MDRGQHGPAQKGRHARAVFRLFAGLRTKGDLATAMSFDERQGGQRLVVFHRVVTRALHPPELRAGNGDHDSLPIDQPGLQHRRGRRCRSALWPSRAVGAGQPDGLHRAP